MVFKKKCDLASQLAIVTHRQSDSQRSSAPKNTESLVVYMQDQSQLQSLTDKVIHRGAPLLKIQNHWWCICRTSLNQRRSLGGGDMSPPIRRLRWLLISLVFGVYSMTFECKMWKLSDKFHIKLVQRGGAKFLQGGAKFIFFAQNLPPHDKSHGATPLSQ